MSLKARACVYVSALEASRARLHLARASNLRCLSAILALKHPQKLQKHSTHLQASAAAMGRSQPLKVMKKLKKVQAISERTGKPKIVRQDRGRILASVGVRIKAS